MKLMLISIFMLFSFALWAESWSIGDKALDVVRFPQKNSLISKSCLADKNIECQALTAMKNKIPSDTGPGGTNPGSGVCQKHHKGSVFIAKDELGNETAFCRFSDGSLLSLDGLWRW